MARKVSPKQDVPVPAAPRNVAPARIAVPRPEPVEEARRSYAARGIAGLLAPVVRPAFRKRAPAAAQLLADWDSLAGPEISSRAAPLKFAGGTLTMGCTGPVAMELQHVAPQLISRLNLGLGRVTVERLRFVQEAPRLDVAAAGRRPRAAVTPPSTLPEGPVGEALARLYQGLMTKD